MAGLASMHIASALAGNVHQRGVGDNPEGVATSRCLLAARFQFVTNTNNKNDPGHEEHTGLFSQKNALTPRRERMRKNDPRRSAWYSNLHHKVTAVLINPALKLVVELDAGATDRSKEVLEGRCI